MIQFESRHLEIVNQMLALFMQCRVIEKNYQHHQDVKWLAMMSKNVAQLLKEGQTACDMALGADQTEIDKFNMLLENLGKYRDCFEQWVAIIKAKKQTNARMIKSAVVFHDGCKELSSEQTRKLKQLQKEAIEAENKKIAAAYTANEIIIIGGNARKKEKDYMLFGLEKDRQKQHMHVQAILNHCDELKGYLEHQPDLDMVNKIAKATQEYGAGFDAWDQMRKQMWDQETIVVQNISSLRKHVRNLAKLSKKRWLKKSPLQTG